MSGLALRVDGVSKQYKIGQRSPRSSAGDLRLIDRLRWLLTDRTRDAKRVSDTNHIWALKDVSFEVKSGEVVGLLGRNGAGKSTLLKILSRITDPTAGRAEIYGRLGSLLEVGTGFHPELTGRENIYLNAAILGTKKVDVDRKFDEIVAFSEVEKFIDTPVKRYSSGMYVRLAFSVAAHLEPEILLLDEVLSVGDSGFQKKCLNHIRTLTSSGATILLVSHNLVSVASLCQRAVWIESGSVLFDGQTKDAIKLYVDRMNSLAASTVGGYLETSTRRGTGEVRLTAVDVVDDDGLLTTECQTGGDIRIRVRYRAVKDVAAPEIGFALRDSESGVEIVSVRAPNAIPDLVAGTEGVAECVLTKVPLLPRRYAIYVNLQDHDYRRPAYDVWDAAGAEFSIVSRSFSRGDYIPGHHGAILDVQHVVTNRLLGNDLNRSESLVPAGGSSEEKR